MGASWFHPLTARINDEGTYDPSPFTIFLGTSKKTKYNPQKYDATVPESTKPILVVCTDDGKLEMANGKVFNTGNHPVEMLVPMLHFRDAGFTFEIATVSGGPVVLEMWAFPTKDTNVIEFYESIKGKLDEPKKLSDISSLDGYSGIFIPGGHGSMINLPSSADCGRLLLEANEKKMPTVTLCHGPAALLSAKASNNDDNGFCYNGYKAFCFTDKTDATTPSFGYLPGEMPWKCQESLEECGMMILNKTETGGVMQDKELITGDSPQAAQALGAFAAPILVKHVLDAQ